MMGIFKIPTVQFRGKEKCDISHKTEANEKCDILHKLKPMSVSTEIGMEMGMVFVFRVGLERKREDRWEREGGRRRVR